MSNSILVNKLEAIPFGYVVKKVSHKKDLVVPRPWLRRRWVRFDHRFVEEIGNANVWKNARFALRTIGWLQPVYKYYNLTLELTPVYSDPKQTGMDALNSENEI